jgi:hypothetical protein
MRARHDMTVDLDLQPATIFGSEGEEKECGTGESEIEKLVSHSLTPFSCV